MNREARRDSRGRTVTSFSAFIAGLVLVAVSSYSQWLSMDLGTWSLGSYLAADLTALEWWRAIGVPAVVGVSLVGGSLWIKSRPVTRKGACLLAVLSVIVTTFSRTVAPAAIILVLSAIVVIWSEARTNRRRS